MHNTDNMVYGKGCKNPTVLEDSLYEVPVDTMQHAEKNEQELVGLTDADPHPYEYATLGPNEEMVMCCLIVCVCVCVCVCACA